MRVMCRAGKRPEITVPLEINTSTSQRELNFAHVFTRSNQYVLYYNYLQKQW